VGKRAGVRAHFRFSEDAWKKISEALAHLGPIVQDDYCAPVRHLLEDVIDHWLLLDAAVLSKNESVSWGIWQAVQTIRDAATKSDVGKRLVDSRVLEALGPLETKCSDFLREVEEVRSAARPGRVSRNGHRDQLIVLLLVIWKDRGGAAKTSMASDGTPSGPLIRFLTAMTDSVGINLTPGAARKLVRVWRGFLEPPVAQICG
jgi:hypothetical protein